ncbi:60S ribosomal protein L13, putative [Plasmodium knowlesi strain H]|uniref:60S ribosomal protein L13, putative n=3 Tax=Plasmodium knowlesi TaxID=5850 RepID=A0A5K1UCW0_PLAKH|nr:60S ribosomal protein L13, putative [Plasmodium knowlesi strain H]OTN65939.1 putative 60S ribosomal protein L13 [Plasmodium knowlesi]CAA9987671.1 60S ribosomal protein L13, putative [Plasmodium knowlesi strain H]SBO26887.1 60S ribosomal protein L13, putative [Plasmodium knowlesi strain H]SBO29651.1 60S ribosomal protein L13, putative [Plasmodium knowlesi strain H]VVS77145.1 60S ribosomal protein L13, putative [Plasmodium knowlesi strain H]|eukprot:XP_002258669.1 ribosomal protein l13, putative [Plasmodium knowlesi strain H]
MYKKVYVIDCKGHLLGRLASIIAKELLNGQRVVAVRCEDINISGSLYRNRLKYQEFLRLRTNTNPKKGPLHLREPSKILWRCVRGMLPHKTYKGKIALKKLKVFVGMPYPYDKKKKYVLPSALRAFRLKKHRRYCRLGTLSSRVGWNYDELVKKNEVSRKNLCKLYYKKKVSALNEKKELKAEALNMINPEERKVLENFGYA